MHDEQDIKQAVRTRYAGHATKASSCCAPATGCGCGDAATVSFEALPDLVLTGHVDLIQVRGTGDAGNVVFAVAIKPDTHNPQLRWNMTATVRITPSD